VITTAFNNGMKRVISVCRPYTSNLWLVAAIHTVANSLYVITIIIMACLDTNFWCFGSHLLWLIRLESCICVVKLHWTHHVHQIDQRTCYRVAAFEQLSRRVHRAGLKAGVRSPSFPKIWQVSKILKLKWLKLCTIFHQNFLEEISEIPERADTHPWSNTFSLWYFC